jgi:hypothetical protein
MMSVMPTLDLALIHGKPGDHSCFFSSTDGLLIDAAGVFTLAGLQAAQKVRLILTEPHALSVEQFLRSMSYDPRVSRRQGRFRWVDAQKVVGTTLSKTGPLDRTAVRDWIQDLLGPPDEDGKPTRVFGEAAGMLAGLGRGDLAAALEEVWNEVAVERPLIIFCPYPRRMKGTDRTRIPGLHTDTIL